MPLYFVRNDIVAMQTDAVVNAANENLRPGGGVCGAIFNSAGFDKLERACAKISHCDTGSAVITRGFDLSAKYIIHAVGPVWIDGNHGEEELLRGCYRSALKLAKNKRCKSIAFPLISSGLYGYPKTKAFNIAVEEIRAFLTEHSMNVWITLFGGEETRLGRELNPGLEEFISDKYVDSSPYMRRDRYNELHQIKYSTKEKYISPEEWKQLSFDDSFYGAPGKTAGEPEIQPESDFRFSRKESQVVIPDIYRDEIPEEVPQKLAKFVNKKTAAPKTEKSPRKLKELPLDEMLKNADESFSQMMLRLIDERGYTDVEVYNAANLTRQHFSKMRAANYKTSKSTAIAISIALKLDMAEMRELLLRAGYALSPSDKSDIIVSYFVEKGIYDIDRINMTLFDYDLKPLGN